MQYITPYRAIKKEIAKLTDASRSRRRADGDIFGDDRVIQLIRLLIRCAQVDEEWYRKRYPDVDEAIEDGVISSAKAHFLESGYLEGRLPARIVVDEGWYFEQYPDVADGVRDGLFESAAEHFELYGYEEGRLPFAL